jgi:MFS family permease
VSSSVAGISVVEQQGSPPVALDGVPVGASAERDLAEDHAAPRVGWVFVSWVFVSLYTLAYISTSLLFLAPLLVTLALKVNSLVGTEQAPNSLSLVAGVAALLAMFANAFFGRLSDRTSSRLGMRRPWMVVGLLGGSLGVLIVALAPSVPVVLVGWCIAQLFFNALLAALVAVCPTRSRPTRSRPTNVGRSLGSSGSACRSHR